MCYLGRGWWLGLACEPLECLLEGLEARGHVSAQKGRLLVHSLLLMLSQLHTHNTHKTHRSVKKRDRDQTVILNAH